jgi:adenylate kinase family enzyme
LVERLIEAKGFKKPLRTSSMVSIETAIILLVDDEIVCDIIYEKIQLFESKRQSWIIQGFPRTRK